MREIGILLRKIDGRMGVLQRNIDWTIGILIKGR